MMIRSGNGIVLKIRTSLAMAISDIRNLVPRRSSTNGRGMPMVEREKREGARCHLFIALRADIELRGYESLATAMRKGY